MSYPAGRILETANRMTTNAQSSLEQHNAAWAKIQAYVQSFPGFMQGPLLLVLTPYERRLRSSYQWQLDCAKTLTSGMDQMQQTDTAVSNTFKAPGFGRDTIS
jgi:hypothetical protein